jgi:hypothetical protein
MELERQKRRVVGPSEPLRKPHDLLEPRLARGGRIDELKNELAADHFCLRSFFATESVFLAVLFSSIS